MVDENWPHIKTALATLPEGRRAVLVIENVEISIEWREATCLALRQVAAEYSRPLLLQLSVQARPWQLIECQGRKYLCAVQREDINLEELERLACYPL